MKKALKAAVLSGIAAMFSVALAGNAAAAQTQTAASAGPVNVLIKHDTKGMEITKDKNMCVMCHADDYGRIGKAKKGEEGTEIPANHWVKGKDGKMTVAPSAGTARSATARRTITNCSLAGRGGFPPLR